MLYNYVNYLLFVRSEGISAVIFGREVDYMMRLMIGLFALRMESWRMEVRIGIFFDVISDSNLERH